MVSHVDAAPSRRLVAEQRNSAEVKKQDLLCFVIVKYSTHNNEDSTDAIVSKGSYGLAKNSSAATNSTPELKDVKDR